MDPGMKMYVFPVENWGIFQPAILGNTRGIQTQVMIRDAWSSKGWPGPQKERCELLGLRRSMHSLCVFAPLFLLWTEQLHDKLDLFKFFQVTFYFGPG